MFKRLISCALSVILFIASFSAASANSGILSELSECFKIYAYSGTASAYFYGFTDQTLCSTRVIPDVMTRRVSVNGSIISVCHDDSNAYALYITAQHEHFIMQMNMDSGDCVWFQIAKDKTVSGSSIAACNGEVMVITISDGAAMVFGQGSGKNCVYSFSSDVKELFVNENRAYALLNDGSLYRIGGGSKALCANLSPFSGLSNAGCGWMFAPGGFLVSINGSVEYTHAKAAVKLNGNTVEHYNARLLACALNKAVSLNNDYSFDYIGESYDEAPRSGISGQEKTLKSGGIAVFNEGMTVSKLKSSYSNVIGIYSSNGDEIGSGALRTGFSAKLSSGSCLIAVLGDVNGSGTVNSADTKALMRFFTGSETRTECEITAADYNKDGTTDNRDLVLISRAAN